MPEVNADPEKLKQLAGALQKAAQQCEQISRQLQRSLDNTGWRDPERTKFEQNLKESLKALNRIADHMKSQLAPQLQKKAAALEQFHR